MKFAMPNLTMFKFVQVKIGKERSDSNSRSATPQLSDSDSTSDIKNDAKPNIAVKPRTHRYLNFNSFF